MRRAILGVVGAVAVVAVGYGVRLRSSQSTAKPGAGEASAAAPSASAGDRPVAVVTIPVAQRDVPVTLEGLGSVTAFNTVTVRPQVDGRLESIVFREGQTVKKGELLAQIDSRPYVAQLRLAQAALTRDKATVEAKKVSSARVAALRQDNLASQQQFDDERAALAVAEAVAVGDEAQIEAARLNVEYSRVVAPIDGVTGVRLVDVGNVVRASDPSAGLVVITQIDPIAILFTLPQDDLPRVSAEMVKGSLEATAMDRDGDHLLGKGQVALVDNQINQATATIRLKAILPNPDRALWPNQFVKVKLLLTTEKDALVVPAAVVQRGPTGTFAYVVGPDQRATARPVTVGRLEGDIAIIAKGLSAGETVVTEGQYQLRPGARVVERSGNGASDSTRSGGASPSASGRSGGPSPSASGRGGHGDGTERKPGASR